MTTRGIPGALLLFPFAFLLLTVPILQQPSAAKEQESPPELNQVFFTRSLVEDMTEAHRQSHRDNFRPLSLFLPYYSIAPGVRTSVSVLNRFSDSFVVVLTALTSQGEALLSVDLKIAGGSHTSLSLNEVLAHAESEFVDGSVRIDFWGEEWSIGAWAVVKAGSQATEIPFIDSGKIQSTRAQSFWDTRSLDKTHRIEPVYALLNTSDSVLAYSATVATSANSIEKIYQGKLQPHAVEILSPGNGTTDLAAGSITIEHDGRPGDLISIGLLQGESFLSPLPVFDPQADASTQYYAARMPIRTTDSQGRAVSTRALLSAFNSTPKQQEASVFVFDPETGEELISHEGILAPGSVNSLDIAELLSAAYMILDGDSVRVAVTHSGKPGAVRLSARSVGADNQVVYVPMIAAPRAHHNGMVPLPGLDEHSVVATWTNLGSESASVVAQIDWEGGSYALPSITVAPGVSHRIGIAELAENGPPDLLGRVLDPEYQNAVLRWSSRAGSLALIARTEADIMGGDHFGFQGRACCYEVPYGELLPPSPVFEVGESILFQASEFRATCAGTMGPFGAEVPSLDYESNFNWTGNVLSATSPGEGQFSFIASSFAIDSTCSMDHAEYGDRANGAASSPAVQDSPTGKEREYSGVERWDSSLPVGSGYSTVGAGGPTPDPDSVDALWTAHKGLVSKFAIADGSLLFDLTGASYRRLAVDPTQRTLWAVGKNGLASYAFDGTLNFLFSAMDTSNSALAVNPNDGTAWVGLDTALSLYSPSGTLERSLTLASKVVDFVFDDNLGRMWAAGKLSATAYDTAGRELLSLDVSALGAIKAMTVSPVTGDVWVADKDELARYDAAGVFLATLAIGKVANLEADTLGGVWAATDKDLYRLDAATGAVLFQMNEFSGSGEIRSLAIQANDNSVWLSLKKTLHRVSTDAVILQTVTLRNDVKEIAVHADAVGPNLAFTTPSPGSFQATNVPTLGLSFSDNGIGVGTATLAIEVGGNPLSVSCTFTATTATCTPLSALPEGLVNLTATIADFEGNLSNQAALGLTVDTMAPVITLNSPQDGDEVETEEINFVGSLNETGTLTLDANPVMLGPSNEFDHGPVTLSEGANALQLVAADLTGNTTTAEITVTFVMPSSFVFDPIGDQTVGVGTTSSLTLTATDPGGRQVTFGSTSLPLPNGLTLDAETGLFTVSPTSSEVGIISLTFFATNGEEALFQTLQITVPAPDPSDPTSFTGQLLDANDYELGTVTPIVGATVSFLNSGVSGVSDGNGFITLTGLPSGTQILDIDTASAIPAPDGSNYAGFREQYVLEANSSNLVTRPFFLPRIADLSLTTVDPNATTVVTNAALGVSITVPPHTAKNPDGTDFTGQLSISEVPRGLAPAPLPDTLDPALLVTIQPVGVIFATPVPITFPNLDQLPVGNEVDIWSLDPATGAFSIVGVGEISADGQSLETISGGVRAADWHMQIPPECDGDEQPDAPNCACGDSNDGGSRVNTRGGWLSTDFSIPDYRSQGQSRGLRFVYRSERAYPQSLIPFDGTVVTRAAIPPTVSYRIKLGGVEQEGETFVSTAGFDEAQDETFRSVIAVDGTNLTTGVYPYTARLTSNYLSSRVSTTFTDRTVVINEQASPIGAGWGISGLTRLYLNFDESALIVGGDGSQSVFLPAPLSLNDWQPEANLSVNTWTVAADGKSVVLTEPGNGPPTFFISPNNFINTTISGKIRVVNSFDDDFIGFVFGYRSPISGNGDPDETARAIIFDWKQGAQSFPGGFFAFAGKTLFRVEGEALDGSSWGPTYWEHTPSANVEILSPTQGSPWINFTDHLFTLQYDTDRIVISIDGVEIFDVAGSFPPGRFGFYNFSQSNVRYELFTSVGTFTSLDGDFSELIGYEDGTFSRTLKNGTRFEYDANGMQTAKLDRNGNTTTYAYDAQERLISITDPVGKVYSSNTLSSVTDPASRVTTFAHDANGNMTRVTLPDTTTRSFGYDNRHLMTSETDARNLTTTRQYDFTGRFIQSTRPDGSTRQVTNMQSVGLVDLGSGLGSAANPAPFVRPNAAISTFTDGNGHVEIFETDRFGKLTRMTDANGLTTITDRDADGNAIRTVRPDGSEILRTFDRNGNLLTVTEAFNGAMTTNTYDSTFSLLTSRTDPQGNRTTFTPDSNGSVVQRTNDLGHVTTMAYNPRGLLTRSTDPNGLVMIFTYDAAGLLISQIETPPPGGGLTRRTTLTHDAAGQITQVLTPGGISLTMDYDPNGRLIRVTDNLNQKIEFAHDGEGNLIQTQVKDPDGTLATTLQQAFDNLGRLQSISRPHVPGTDSVLQLRYDNSENATGQTDPNGNVSSSSYDPGDRLDQNTDVATGSTTYVYDDNGNTTRVSAPNGAITTYTFDALGRQLTEASPDRGILTYAYDLAGNRSSATDARGIRATFSYDDLSRVTSVTYPDASENVFLVYDSCPFGVGRLCSRTDESGSYGFAYDAYGNVLQVNLTILGVTYITTYQYDAGHQVVSMTLPSGRIVSYQRDGLGRTSAIDAVISGINTALLSDVAYRADGALTASQHGNGIAETRTYDQQGRLAQQTIGTADSVVLTYDANSNVLSRDTQTNTHTHGYDVLNRLATETNDGATLDYTYDPNGNRLTTDDGAQATEYAYGAGNNQLIRIDATALTYDLTGNLTDNGQGQSYTYNDANRLFKIFDQTTLISTYIYNALGQRMRKTTATGTTIFHYDLAGRLIAETAADGTPLRDYVWQQASPIAQIEGDTVRDTLTHLHSDHLRTPRLGTDVAGNVVWRWEGTAFGATQPVENPASVNLRLPGQYADAESGLLYNWHRYYDPLIGRYITSDPIGLGGGFNSYLYAAANPLVFTDPTGEYWWWTAAKWIVQIRKTARRHGTTLNPHGEKRELETYCYIDTNANGIPDCYDRDMDGDGKPDNEDDDIDGDGILNEDDEWPYYCPPHIRNRRIREILELQRPFREAQEREPAMGPLMSSPN